MKIRAYGYKESSNCFMPRDVLDALGEPVWVRQGGIVVFAATAAEAFRHLSRLDLKPRSVRELGLLHGRSPEALAAAGLSEDGAVYAMPMDGWTVALVQKTCGTRLVDVIGEISREGVFVPREPCCKCSKGSSDGN